jgi:hypothetical protein
MEGGNARKKPVVQPPWPSAEPIFPPFPVTSMRRSVDVSQLLKIRQSENVKTWWRYIF